MKTKTNTPKIFHNPNQAFKMIWVAGIIGIGISTIINPTWAESSNPVNQNSKIETEKKLADGNGNLPTFSQADSNGDHYVTKDELQNHPSLLQLFDKVDAGHNGKLEQHEYQNLEMETKREGEVK
ncbi:EF-hand domain-containing protein [Methylomonas sp. AM2-LC]|uniref:EF-hand domain-containing protein n=1 Tax=Methylomonas sp. AM2-LC TaxID=3153301 RepID=UPI00326415E8